MFLQPGAVRLKLFKSFTSEELDIRVYVVNAVDYAELQSKNKEEATQNSFTVRDNSLQRKYNTEN